MACAGDVPTLETLAAVDLLRQHLPDLKIRVVNVVDLMTLQPHERASARPDATAISTRCSRRDKPVIFAYHGYPWLIHRLTYRRDQPRQHPCARLQGGRHDDDAVRHGGAATSSTASISSPTSSTGCRTRLARAAYVKQAMRDKLIEHQFLRARAWRRHARGKELALVRAGGV